MPRTSPGRREAPPSLPHLKQTGWWLDDHDGRNRSHRESTPETPNGGFGLTDDDRSITTRREFIAGLGASSLSLLALWGGFGFLKNDGDGGAHMHGHGSHGPDPKAFAEEARAWADQHERSDGWVEPPVPEDDHDHSHAPEVYMLAYRWDYRPNKIVLQRETAYRFRMLATDVQHGASINMGNGSMMIRLPPGVVTERTLQFEETGEYLVYCSEFCGHGHDDMHARIRVVD